MKVYRVYQESRAFQDVKANSIKIENGDLIFLNHAEVYDERYLHTKPTIIYKPVRGFARGYWSEFKEVTDEIHS